MEDEERGNLGKHSKEQIISAEKKKKLMKKLSRIRLNRSRANASFFDISAFYEAKIRKLKLNNISLAKAHSEQKQISQTWYDTVVSLKEELQDSQESLLRLHYQVKGNGDYEHYIQESVQRRIRVIAEPLDASVSATLRDASNLVDNLTKVKHLTSSLLSFSNKEKLNFSRRSSHSLLGSRPPLSQNSKSPRKNVVHPMVEGHVLQPATIPIPRMTLEERRRYRLQDPEIVGMEVIGELSSSSESESTISDADDSTSDQIIDEENEGCHLNFEDAINDDETAAESVKSESHDEEGLVNGDSNISPLTPDAMDSALGEDKSSIKEEVSPEENQLGSGSESPSKLESETQRSGESFKEESLSSSLKLEKVEPVCDEDPLEGSSWMHLIKGRSKNKKRKKCGGSNLRSSGLHFLPDTSSESEEEHLEIPVGKVKHGKVKGSAKNRPSRSKSSKVSLSHLDLLTSKVSKRSKKSDDYSVSSTKDSKDTNDLNNQNEEPRSSSLPSFIINDSQTDLTLFNENLDIKNSPTEKENKNIPTMENKNPTPTSPNSGLHLDPVVNLTCISDSPMEITECLSNELLQSLPPFTEQPASDTVAASSSPPKEKEISDTKTDDTQNSSNDIGSGNTLEKLQSNKTSQVKDNKKTKKYFKTQDNETNEVVSKKQTESCIYDISLMDASQITSCLTNVGKENVPPNINVSSEDLAMKIKDISIVVTDIMKTPPSSDVDPNAPFYGFPNTCNNQSNNITQNKSNRTTSEKNKCKGKRKGSASPLKKVSKKPRKKNFSDCALSILSSPPVSDDEDVWSPTKKPKKRKTKCLKKNITSSKKLKQHTGEIIEKSSAAGENIEIIPMTKANDINVNNDNNNGEHQIVNPLCEMQMDSNTLGPVSSVIIQDVNDIIRKQLKKEMKNITTCDNYEVIDLDSEEEGEEDPLAIEEVELINGRPRRAALKIQSFKEPALNTKMRNSAGRKAKKPPPKKKSLKT